MKDKFNIVVKTGKQIAVLFVAIFILGVTENSYAQDRKIDTNALISETQRQSKD